MRALSPASVGQPPRRPTPSASALIPGPSPAREKGGRATDRAVLLWAVRGVLHGCASLSSKPLTMTTPAYGMWSTDVDGLRVEGETIEAFRRNVADAATDLLEGAGEIHIEIIAQASVRAGAPA